MILSLAVVSAVVVAVTQRAVSAFGAALLLATVVAHVNDGATPALAIVNDFGDPSVPRIRIVRTNVVGRFATVSTRGVVMEAEPLREAILLERFSFGWQPLEAVYDSCLLAEQETNARDRERLMRGMPATHEHSGVCNTRPVRDFGPRRDVEAIRARMDEPLVPYVAVYGRFALGSWSGGGGGEQLWRRHGAGWVRLTGGGGALGSADMRAYGVSRAARCAFGVYDVSCPTR